MLHVDVPVLLQWERLVYAIEVLRVHHMEETTFKMDVQRREDEVGDKALYFSKPVLPS